MFQNAYNLQVVPIVLHLYYFLQDTCSELCEKSEYTIQFTTGQSEASIDRRWSRLLELKKAL